MELFLREAVAESRRTGKCIACDEVLRRKPYGRIPVTCSDRLCKKYYHQLYYMDRKARGRLDRQLQPTLTAALRRTRRLFPNERSAP